MGSVIGPAPRDIYMSIESVKRKMPWFFSMPSTPLGGRGKGSVRAFALGESVDLSMTSAKPCDLIASTSAGTESCSTLVVVLKTMKGYTYQKSRVAY